MQCDIPDYFRAPSLLIYNEYNAGLKLKWIEKNGSTGPAPAIARLQ